MMRPATVGAVLAMAFLAAGCGRATPGGSGNNPQVVESRTPAVEVPVSEPEDVPKSGQGLESNADALPPTDQEPVVKSRVLGAIGEAVRRAMGGSANSDPEEEPGEAPKFAPLD